MIVSRVHIVCKTWDSNTVLLSVQLSGLSIQLTQASVGCCISSTTVFEAVGMIIGAGCFRTPKRPSRNAFKKLQ